jgi:hypothetical protein
VVRALDTTITNLAGRQGGAPVPADIGLDARDEVLITPNDVILVTKTHASGLLAEGRRTGDCDPTLHTYYTRLFLNYGLAHATKGRTGRVQVVRDESRRRHLILLQ